MTRYYLFLLFFAAPMLLFSQTMDSLMRSVREAAIEKPDKIALARTYLRDAFNDGDIGTINAWLGFLQTDLEDDSNAPTLADERWLLYYWTDNYSLLFMEAEHYKDLYNQKYQYQNPPPEDDLFRMVDQASFDHRFELYSGIQRAFLSEEEKAFAVLLLDFLLRTDVDKQKKAEQQAKGASFLTKYPTSRFNTYIRSHIYNDVKPRKDGFGVDLLLHYGRNNGALGINLGHGFGIGGGLTYWRKRMNYTFRGQVGSQKVRREFYDFNEYISKDSAATIVEIGLETGFDLVNNNQIRIMPAIGGGFSFLRIPYTPDYLEEYAGKFRSNQPYWSACLNIDWKLNNLRPNDRDHRSSFGAVRFRLGFKGQYWGKDNPEVDGSQVFLGVGLMYQGSQNNSNIMYF